MQNANKTNATQGANTKTANILSDGSNAQNTSVADKNADIQKPEAKVASLLDGVSDADTKSKLGGLSSKEQSEIGKYETIGQQFQQNLSLGNTSNKQGSKKLQEAVNQQMKKVAAQKDISSGQETISRGKIKLKAVNNLSRLHKRK